MVWESPKDAMPWVGVYVSVASFLCAFAMAIDAIQAIWKWKHWFPNRFFTLNASTITLIAIAMKLPVDLTTTRCEGIQVSSNLCDSKVHHNPNIMDFTKLTGMRFLITMLANFLPSLGLMDDKELVMNIAALGILLITISVNIGIQLYTQVLFLFPETFPIFLASFLWLFSVALTVSTSRKKLEHRYNESQILLSSSHQEKVFSSKGLRNYVKKYWMMTETRNPQFVIACSPVSSAFGVICLYFAFWSGAFFVDFLTTVDHKFIDTSEYKWSLDIIFIVQSIGIIVGSIAPIFRCFTSIGHYNLSKEWSKNHLNVFRVEKSWIERLQQWKNSHNIHSYIRSYLCKIIFIYIKDTFLNLCIALHIAVLIMCKIICLVPRTFMVLFSCCWYFFTSFFKSSKWVSNASTRNVSFEVEQYYSMYVVQIEEEAKLSKRILRNTLRYITKLIKSSEQKEPRNLMMLLEKSRGFNGLSKLKNDKVQPLYPEEAEICWSLVIVTLTSVAIALPQIANGHLKGLLSGISEGLLIVRQIEKCLNVDGDRTINARKAARRLWTEVEIYNSWLQVDLQKKARSQRKNIHGDS